MTVAGDLNSYINEAEKNLDKIKFFLDDVSLAVNSLTAISRLSQTTIDGYRSDVSTARTNMNTAITNFSSAKEKLNTAETNLVIVQNQLNLMKAGTLPEKISSQEATVEKAKANIKNINAKINKTVLYSPINGIITKQDAKVGEIVSANTILVSIISESDFEIEADVPEADIAKIKIGDKAALTLDAYGDDVEFGAIVVRIDPAETVIEGVSNYKVTLNFSEKDNRIRSGMTANLDILTEKKENVISVPQRAVIIKNGDKLVRILVDDEKIEERSVKTGLRGSSGNIEIIEGVNEGDKVITFVRE